MKKIIFIAIVAYTGEVTSDGRVLCTPATIKTRPYPLPVRAQIKGATRIIGQIEQAAVCDRRLIIFGKLDPAKVAGTPIVDCLANGTYAFEIDVDQVKQRFEDEIFRMIEWRLAAVTVGADPCWKLPPPQIEEMEIKEMTHA